jgi:hypothetical protein
MDYSAGQSSLVGCLSFNKKIAMPVIIDYEDKYLNNFKRLNLERTA